MAKPKWPDTVKGYAEQRGLRYEEVGGINPRDGPVALCVGGPNRITGQLSEDFWGASCDADQRKEGGLFRRRVVPGAALVKAHMPDLADVVGAFNVESVERRAGEMLAHRFGRKVEFESLDFNRRYLATVPSEYDPVALRELFGPGFLDWVTGIENQIEFGVNDRQLWFLWRLRELTGEELDLALGHAGELFRRLRIEMYEGGLAIYPPGPWHAGIEYFPERKSG